MMLIAGLIGVNLVLALLAVWAIKLLRSPDPARSHQPLDADATPTDDVAMATLVDDAALSRLVDDAVTGHTTEVDSLEALFAYDSRRPTADQH